MGLQPYRSKRDFGKTVEPEGSPKSPSGDGLLYVFQKHAARRLHHDLRLEHGGTLKSRTVPKVPSLDPDGRRLAVEVEDHPLECADFEGTIPEGQYGAGSVLVWDRGAWEPEGDPGRKALLPDFLRPQLATLVTSPPKGGDFFRHACALGAEGAITKRADAPYRSGRSRSWLKIKCSRHQELVVLGYTDPEGSRKGFGALLPGHHDEAGALRYAGRVGTGFDRHTLLTLHRRLAPLKRTSSPLSGPLPAPRERRRRIHWVEPRLVAEVSFGEWTREGILRHASFVGLREDVMPEEVQRERARPTREVAEGNRPAGKGKARQRASGKAKGASPAPERPRDSKNRHGAIEVAAERLTHPDRVLYPETGVTKHQLALYYLEVAERMLPEISHRPLSLVRCPTGLSGDCFYQKQLGEGFPEALVPVEIEERSGKRQTYASVDSPAGLVALAQIGVLEIHPWGSRSEDLEHPDRLIFDLDPGPGVPWSEMVAAARRLRRLLQGLGLESLPKLTGGKGLHLVVPIEPELEWAEVKAFSRAVAHMLSAEDPEGFTTNPSKAKRQRRIFVDYLRNDFGATAVAIYSTRAKPAAPLAVPIRWDELGPRLEPDRYRLGNIRRRLAALAEAPWAGIDELQQRIDEKILTEIRNRG